MDKPTFKLVGSPCGQHGQYTFYKALRVSGQHDRIIAIGDFFFVRIWQDSELVSIGELQLLWTDRVSDQTLVSLRLYFLPENTPDGRNLHGQDEVLAINDKVVLRAEDLLTWVCSGTDWRWGLRAVWRGACAPPADARATAPLHRTKLDFSDVEKEKSTIAVDAEHPGVVVFSYPRYCRYRALLARLEGIQGDWLRDSLVAALGGYAAPTKNTRILYCKDTFEYPELEGHEFVCNHLAPRLKGRPRGRRRRRARSRSRSPSSRSRSSDSDAAPHTPAAHPAREHPLVLTPRRLSLRNGAPSKLSEEEDERAEAEVEGTPEDAAFLKELRQFYRDRNEPFKVSHSLKDLSLRALYGAVCARGGYEAVCRLKLWRALRPEHPARTRRHYERFLLSFENHQRRNGSKQFPKLPNGKTDLDLTIDTIDVTDSPLRDVDTKPELPEKRLRTPSPKKEEKPELKEESTVCSNNETGENEVKEDLNITSKPAEELNREFLESLPKEEEKPLKISVKPVEKLIDTNLSVITDLKNNAMIKLFEENSTLINELAAKHNLKDSHKVIAEIRSKELSDGSAMFLSELAQKLNLGNADSTFLSEITRAQQELSTNALGSLSTLGDKYAVNGHSHNGGGDHQKSRPAGRSSLRAVRVKPTRPNAAAHTPPIPPLRADSASSSPQPPTVTTSSATSTASAGGAPPVTNFGIHHPPVVTSSNSHSDDEIVEVPYKPKTPEIIDLDEYPESPQAMKKKKLDILKERGLEVTAIPTVPAWPTTAPAVIASPIAPLINPAPIMLNPAMQHQIMTQAQLFQMYNILPQNYANGIQPPKVIQATSIFGSSGPEKTVYGNPKDPFMPPPHILHGAPLKPQKSVQTPQTPAQDILDLTCKNQPSPSQKPAVEIVRIPTVPSPSKVTSSAQNLTKNYTLIDGKAVVGSNLEITLVNPKSQTPTKNRVPQKRSSNGKFMSTKTPTPPKDYPKPYASPSPSGVQKKPPIVVPNFQMNSQRDDVSPTSSTGSRDSQTNLAPNNLLQNVFKGQNSLAHIMEMQKTVPSITPFMDPMYMNALYTSLAGQMDQRQLAMYRDFMANQFRGYSGLLNLGAVTNTPTTKN